jgi:hypothetical protein
MDLRKIIQQEINNVLTGSNNQPYLEPEKTKKNKSSLRKRSILQFTLDGVLVKEFESVKAAERELGVSDKYVAKHLRGITKTCKGYIFRYKD